MNTKGNRTSSQTQQLDNINKKPTSPAKCLESSPQPSSCNPNKEMLSNTETTNMKPIYVIADGDRHKTSQLGKNVKLVKSHVKMRSIDDATKIRIEQLLLNRKRKLKVSVGSTNMTQETVKIAISPNSSAKIHDIERYLYEYIDQIEKEANKENCPPNVKPNSPCKKCLEVEKYFSLEATISNVPSAISDTILDLKEDYKIEPQDVLPEDLEGVPVDPNLFVNFQELDINYVIKLYDVTLPKH